MRGLVAAVIREAAVVVHGREALPYLLGVDAANLEALELFYPLFGLAVLGAAHAATLGASVWVGRVERERVDGVAHGRAVGALAALCLGAPVFLEVPAVLVVVVAILRAIARTADDHGELLGEVTHHADAEGEHGDGDDDEAEARLATGGEDLLVADDHLLDVLSGLFVAFFLIVEDLVLGLLQHLGLHRREHLGGGGGMYPVRDL